MGCKNIKIFTLHLLKYFSRFAKDNQHSNASICRIFVIILPNMHNLASLSLCKASYINMHSNNPYLPKSLCLFPLYKPLAATSSQPSLQSCCRADSPISHEPYAACSHHHRCKAFILAVTKVCSHSQPGNIFAYYQRQPLGANSLTMF